MGRKKIVEPNDLLDDSIKVVEYRYKSVNTQLTYDFTIKVKLGKPTEILDVQIKKSKKDIHLSKCIDYLGSAKFVNLMNKALKENNLIERNEPFIFSTSLQLS